MSYRHESINECKTIHSTAALALTCIAAVRRRSAPRRWRRRSRTVRRTAGPAPRSAPPRRTAPPPPDTCGRLQHTRSVGARPLPPATPLSNRCSRSQTALSLACQGTINIAKGQHSVAVARNMSCRTLRIHSRCFSTLRTPVTILVKLIDYDEKIDERTTP